MPTTAATVYSDGAGNKYLGDVTYHNPLISYPNSYLLESIRFSDDGDVDDADNYPYVLSMKALFNAFSLTEVAEYDVLGLWDSATSKVEVVLPSLIALNPGTRTKIGDDTGVDVSGGNVIGPSLYSSSSLSEYRVQDKFNGVVVAMSANHIAFLNYQFSGNNTVKFNFFYVGFILDINTNFTYYNATLAGRFAVTNKVVSTATNNISSASLDIKHRIENTTKSVLTTGDAAYDIVCANATVPTGNWATDFYVFDNNATLGYPCLGRLPGLVLADGTYSPLKPVKIQTLATADGGSKWFLPVGYFGGKTVLMRCHSSQV